MTAFSLSLNSHDGLSNLSLLEGENIDPKIVNLCLDDDTVSRDLNFIGSNLFFSLKELRFDLSQLRFKNTSFAELFENNYELMAKCYGLCDQIDFLLDAYVETLNSSRINSEKIYQSCLEQLKKNLN